MPTPERTRRAATVFPWLGKRRLVSRLKGVREGVERQPRHSDDPLVR